MGDYEHTRIIKVRLSTEESMVKLAKKLSRSSKTIHEHITYHNRMIEIAGECDKCTRINAPFKTESVKTS